MDKVIELKKVKEDDPRVFTVVGGEACGHRRITVDSKERIIKCQDCKEQINAFDALLMIANTEGAQRKVIDEQRKKIDSFQKIYTGIREKLRSMVRYKCRHCGKFNEATANQGWDGEVKGVDFIKVSSDGKRV